MSQLLSLEKARWDLGGRVAEEGTMPGVPSNLPLLRDKSDQMEGQRLTPKQIPGAASSPGTGARGLRGYHSNHHPPSWRPCRESGFL